MDSYASSNQKPELKFSDNAFLISLPNLNNNKELIVGKIDLIRNRINRDRFLRTCKEVNILTSEVLPILSKIDPIFTKPLPIPGSVIRTGPSGITASLTPDPRCHSCSHTPSPAPI